MMTYTRRQIGQLALTMVPAARIFGGTNLFAQAKANSKVNGVQIGLNVPYSFGGRNMEADELLKKCLDMGVSALELRSQPIETFMGAPKELVDGRGTDPAVMEALTKWRLSAPMDKATAFRKKYNDAGVLIEIMKVDGIFAYSDAALDYVFNLAKAVGARAISTEIAEDGPKRLGEFADKHQLMVGYHGHDEDRSRRLDQAVRLLQAQRRQPGHRPLRVRRPRLTDPVPEGAPRPHHAHPRQGPQGARGPQRAVRQGDTPIAEVLRLIRDNKWNDPGDDRVRVSRACRLRSDDRDQEERRVLPQGARVSVRTVSEVERPLHLTGLWGPAPTSCRGALRAPAA